MDVVDNVRTSDVKVFVAPLVLFSAEVVRSQPARLNLRTHCPVGDQNTLMKQRFQFVDAFRSVHNSMPICTDFHNQGYPQCAGMSNAACRKWGIIGLMTTPITVNDISDVARILRERPEWLDIIRSIVVGEELLSVPQQLAELTQTVNALTQRVDDLTQRLDDFIQATNENFRLVYERLDRLEGRFSNYEGNDYERRIRNRLLFRATLRFNLNQPILAMVQDRQSAPELNSIIHRAIQSGAITEDDATDIYNADIIIKDEDNRYLLVEVSITADETDLSRAVRRSGLLAGVADATVIPALVASNVLESQRALADRRGVSLFIIPYP